MFGEAASSCWRRCRARLISSFVCSAGLGVDLSGTVGGSGEGVDRATEEAGGPLTEFIRL
jgi:hypothetical protein